MALPRQPIPVDRELVSAQAPSLPEDVTRLDVPLTRGVPVELSLDAELSLLLQVPTGIAHAWRDAVPTTRVSAARDELAPHDLLARPHLLSQPPARLLVRRAGETLATVPLAAGLRRRLPDSGEGSGVCLELWILDWELHAGTLRGEGDFGSRISLAWRRMDTASVRFTRSLATTLGTVSALLSEDEAQP